MNVFKSNWFSSLLIFIAGVVFCCLYDKSNVMTVIVYILGAVFTATGCINIIMTSLRHTKRDSNVIYTTVGWLAGLGGIGLGAAMLIVPKSFTPIMVYVFAVLLILGGLWHFIVLSCCFKNVKMWGWLYFLPLIILVGGVVMFCWNGLRDNVSASTLVAGIGGLLFGVTTLLEYISWASATKKAAREAKEMSAAAASNAGMARSGNVAESSSGTEKDSVTQNGSVAESGSVAVKAEENSAPQVTENENETK